MKSSRLSHFVASLLGLVWFTAIAGGQTAPVSTPDFELSKWQSPEKIKLADFAGEIVVLDFFAYWCAPCRKASAEIEGGIQKYYAAKKGNPHGVPVRVLAVNIERDNPKLTEKFIKAAGLELVANDFDGALLDKLGGAATPFIVVIDGTRATKGQPDFRILLKQEGFSGTKPLRAIIDAIKPPLRTAQARDIIEQATAAPVVRQADVSSEALLASDLTITSTVLSYGEKSEVGEWKLSYTHNTIAADYAPFTPFDFLGFAERVDEEYDAGAISWRQKLTDELTALAAGGGYDGFTDYRSVWLANYYRQQFSFVPGYETPAPYGYNLSTALRWEYLPASGFADASFFYSYDEIAPGYEFEPGPGVLLQGRSRLETYSPTLKFENVIHRRIRLLNEFQVAFTSGREARYSYRNSLNFALGERWVLRSLGGYTYENPTLRAWFAGATLEFELTPNWLVSVSGLYYHDTGEIENSAFISTAAPGLETWQGGLGVRYAGEFVSVSLNVAPLWADYEPVAVGTQPFANLYRDRDWISVQAAVTFVF
jgi:thiol-disulfide isomerase/thioredoxin